MTCACSYTYTRTHMHTHIHVHTRDMQILPPAWLTQWAGMAPLGLQPASVPQGRRQGLGGKRTRFPITGSLQLRAQKVGEGGVQCICPPLFLRSASLQTGLSFLLKPGTLVPWLPGSAPAVPSVLRLPRALSSALWTSPLHPLSPGSFPPFLLFCVSPHPSPSSPCPSSICAPSCPSPSPPSSCSW